MAMKDIAEYMADGAMKCVSAFGRKDGGAYVARCIVVWEREYGEEITARARKLVTAEWRKRFPNSRAGVCPPSRRHNADRPGAVAAEAQPDTVDVAA